jgi:hypothetical protein
MTKPSVTAAAAISLSSAWPPALERLGQRLVLTGLVLGPLAVLHTTAPFQNSLETPRRLCLFLVAGLLTALILYGWAQRGRLVLRTHALDWAVLALAVGATLSGIGGEYPLISFFGPLWSQDSLLVWGMGWIFYLAVKEFFPTDAAVRRVLGTMVAVGGVVALLGFLDYFFGLTINQNFSRVRLAELPKGTLFFSTYLAMLSGSRLTSTLGNPMFTGTYLAMLIPLGIGLVGAWPSKRGRAVLLACVLALAPALLFTMARAAWVGLLLAVLVVGVLAGVRARAVGVRLTGWLLVVAGGVLLAVACAAAVHPGLRARLGSVVRMEDATVQTRLVYMRGAAAMFLARPVQGWGVGNLKIVFPQYRPSSDLHELGLPLNRGYASALPHNLPLQIAAEMGLLGLVPFVWVLVGLVRGWPALLTGQTARGWLALGLAGSVLTYLLVNLFAFDNSAVMVNFWVLVGAWASLGARERVLTAGGGEYPLSELTRSLVRVASLVIAMGAVLHVVFAGSAAILLQRGAREINVAMQLAMSDRVAGQQAIRGGLSTLNQALRFMPAPDALPYSALVLGCQTWMSVATDQREMELARTALFRAGETGLRQVDRDSILLRLLVMEYTNWGRLERARQLATHLVRVEPHSAETRLLLADVLARHGDVLGAERQARLAAETLDPSYGYAWAMYAHYQFLALQKRDLRGDELAAALCAHFAKAQTLLEGGRLPQGHRMEYVTTLFLLKQSSAAIREGLKLRGTPELEELCKKVKIVYDAYGEPATGQRVIAALRGQ